MENQDVNLLKDILGDLMYLNLEFDAKCGSLNNYGVAMLVELRANKKYNLENRRIRFDKLDKLVTSLELATNGAKGEKGIGGENDR